jgi:hypothetical protein
MESTAMGKIGKKLRRSFRGAAGETGGEMAEDLPSFQELLESGYDPLHAVYIQAQNLTSVFAEGASQLQVCDEYTEIVGEAEDTYRPNGPPISPLTGSYFTTWAFFDFRFGADRETLGSCLLDLADLLEMDEFLVEAIRNFQQTRMGIYEHVGRAGSRVRLRELVTDKEFLCHSTSGYQGKKGELWYARLCPPLSVLRQAADYQIVMTTPYILTNVGKNDWTAYLKKNLSFASDIEQGLHEFLKYGPSTFHWHEFIFQAYHHAQFDAIFLAGLPDVKGSLPHGDLA